ncbi:MAG: hypothetical protein ACLR8Y_07645 [Alistipes indistinctus]
MVLEDTIRRINYHLAGREVRNIKGVGKFRTLKFVCELATSSGDRSGRFGVLPLDIGRPEQDSALPRIADPHRVRARAAARRVEPEIPADEQNQIGGSAGRYGLPCNGNGPPSRPGNGPSAEKRRRKRSPPRKRDSPQKCTDFAGSGPGHPDERQKRDEPKRNNGTGTGKVTQNRRKRQQFNRISRYLCTHTLS